MTLICQAPEDVLGSKLAQGMPAKKLNVCIVGLGRAGHVHLRSLASLGHKAHLSWVVDIDADVVRRVCDLHGCKGTADIEEALADSELDAVVIASATFTHFDYTTRALIAKKAVFTEKPISHDPEELAQVLRLALASNIVFCTGYQRRCDANFRALKRQLDEGAIGGVRVIKCTSRYAQRAPRTRVEARARRAILPSPCARVALPLGAQRQPGASARVPEGVGRDLSRHALPRL